MLDYFDASQDMSIMRKGAYPVTALPNHMDLLDFHYSSAKCHQISPTSTLSSGYESGCADNADIDDLIHSMTLTDDQQQEESDYFLLESDQYVCLGGDTDDETDQKLKQVRDSMLRIVTDLESLGYETSMDELSNAVRSSVRKSKTCSRASSARRSRRANTNNNNTYTKSPVDVMLTEINYMTDKNDREQLYDRLITNIAKECDTSSSDDDEEPIYEEICDLGDDFDFVAHSDTYRKQTKPPALPPRLYNSNSYKPRSSGSPKYYRQVSLPESQSNDTTRRITDKKARSYHAINSMGRCK